jgi:hypothetical protein
MLRREVVDSIVETLTACSSVVPRSIWSVGRWWGDARPGEATGRRRPGPGQCPYRLRERATDAAGNPWSVRASGPPSGVVHDDPLRLVAVVDGQSDADRRHRSCRLALRAPDLITAVRTTNEGRGVSASPQCSHVGGPYFSVVTPLPGVAVGSAAAGDEGRPIPQYSFVRRADADPLMFPSDRSIAADDDAGLLGDP